MESGSKKNVFLVVCVPGQSIEILEIAKLLQSTTDFNPIIYFNLGNVFVTPLMSEILEKGFDVYDYNLGFISADPQKGSTPSKMNSINLAESNLHVSRTQSLKNRVRSQYPLIFKSIRWLVGTYYGLLTLFYRHFGFIHFIMRKLERLKKEEGILRDYSVKLLVLAEDSEGYLTPQLVRVTQKNKARVVVFPYTFANENEFLEDAYLNNRRADKDLSSRLTALIFPKWNRDYKGASLLRWRPAAIFAAELFGGSAPNPWVMNSGMADIIAVESEFMRLYYSEAGIPEKQMLVTGFVSLDLLHKAISERKDRKQKMAQLFGLDLSKPWVVCAVPPSQWPHPGVEFSSYELFLKTYIQYLKSFTNIEVIFKFHPRLSRSEVEKVCADLEVKNINFSTTDLVGVADLYVASVSATIRWALACGLPTINYDLYAYRYDDFRNTVGLQTVEFFADFKSIFALKVDEIMSLFAKEDIKSRQTQFGVLDGKSSARILQLFRRLAS